MADGGRGEEFSVEGRVLGFGGGKLLGEKFKGGPGNMEALLENSTHMRVRCIRSHGDGCTRNRVSENRNRGKEKLGRRQRRSPKPETIGEISWNP